MDGIIYLTLEQVEQIHRKTITYSGGGTYEKGNSQTIVLNWTYNKDIDSQTVNGAAISKELRTTTYTNVVTNTTYTLNAIAGEETKTKNERNDQLGVDN